MSADTVGGVWTFALELARALAAHGTAVALATMGRKLDRHQWREAGGIDRLEIFESDFKLEWMKEPWEDVRRAGDWLLSLEAQFKPDVVHLNTLAHGALPWRAPVLITGHSCVLSWWEAVKHEPAPKQWDRYRSEVTRSLKAADWITAPTHAMLDVLKTNYGFSTEAGVIPNGVRRVFDRSAQKEPFVLAAGRLWDEGKNIAALDRAAARLAWPVYLAGDPSASAAATQLGRLSSEELAGWYARASIYALPARYEPFGLSILEAALSGCALVLGDIASLRENWDGAALFVDPENPEQLEATLQSLIVDTTGRERMAAGARERASRFTAARMAGAYAAAYEKLPAASLCAS